MTIGAREQVRVGRDIIGALQVIERQITAVVDEKPMTDDAAAWLQARASVIEAIAALRLRGF